MNIKIKFKEKKSDRYIKKYLYSSIKKKNKFLNFFVL